MKLEKFERKNKKKIIIGAIIGLILLIGGITLYRTFALYEEKKELDVLKGVIPEFTKGDERGTLIARYPNEESAENEIERLFWQYSENITKVVFEDTFSEKENASYTFDVEESGSKSVKAYLVAETSDASKYTLYIQSENGIIANENSGSLFYNFTNLETIEGLEYLDTSNVINMGWMFSQTPKLKTFDISSFDTSKVEDMAGMFQNTALTSLDLCHFDTSNVIDMNHMFDNNLKLTSLNISSFDTSKVENMDSMFRITGLSNLDLSHFDTSNVTSMGWMFQDSNSLTSLDLSGFKTSNVTDMKQMFYGTTKLKTLDLSHFDTSKVEYMGRMFMNTTSLTTLDISSFTFKSVLEDDGNNQANQAIFYSMPSNIKIYVKDEEAKNWILNARDGTNKTIYQTSKLNANNFIIKS